MAAEYRKGIVYIQNYCAGSIAETDEGYTFSYDADYLRKEKARLGESDIATSRFRI